MNDSLYRPALHRMALASLVVTILLTIGIGGTITSAEVGMAYPTWPDINGGSLFNIFYEQLADAFGWGSVIEHTHRQAGALAGLLVLISAAMTWFRRGTPKHVMVLATSALVLVTVQGLLGAFRVLQNSYEGAIIHAVGAQLVVVLLVALVRTTQRDASDTRPAADAEEVQQLRRWSWIALILLFLNLFAAASLRHKQGAFIGHLALAILTAAVLLYVMGLVLIRFRDRPSLRRDALRISWVLGAQLALGVAAWAILFGPLLNSFDDPKTLFRVQAVIATSHLLCGVLVIAINTSIWLEARRIPARTS